MDIVVGYDGNGRVSSYRDPTNMTTTYAYADAGGERTTTIQVASNAVSKAVFDMSTGLMKRNIDELGHTTSYSYDTAGRLTKVTANDGNSVEYVYDGRGNRTRTTAHPKPGSLFSDGTAMGDLVTTASFPASCANPKTCNQPTATVDAKGAQTDYEYDSGTGLLSKVTQPADTTGVRPQARYGFTALATTWGAGGSITQVKWVATCQAQSACIGAPSELVTEYDYADQSGNLALTGVRMHGGDGSNAIQITYGYDGLGNRTSVTDARGKTTKYGFSAGREPFWTLSPDPDDGGPLRNRMTITDRYSDGTVGDIKTGPADADGSNFSEMLLTRYGYDAAGRKVWEYQDGGGARHSQTEYSYDSLGRLDCTNQRMNFNNLTTVYGNTAVCDLSAAGPWDQDRITRTEYDAAGRVTRAWAGYRTNTAYHTDYAWTNNNKVEHVFDPKGNQTTYYYDGFDRLRYTCFNSPTCSSVPDYEELVYDNNSNVTKRRLRDNGSLNYAYDALNRAITLTSKNPNSTVDRTTRYTYNNQSQVTKAAVDGFATLDVRYTYNVLGRLTHEESDVASLAVDYGYDTNGWLTFLGYGDGYYVNYDYYNTGEMKNVREMGATSGSSVLAQIGIDSLGRRTSLLRGDGSQEARTYDMNGKGPWLDSLSQTMTGGGSFTRSFYYTPANTLFGLYTNNDAYVWTQAINVERTYDTNALNQYTRSGSINLGYDGRGNLTSAPRSRTGSNAQPGDSSSYSYNPQNMLVGANGYTLNYDATGRLVLDSSAADRKYGYAGTRLLTERKISDGSMMNRYVYGPDEAPLMVHDGGSTSGTRHYLITDERGSVVALTNGQGALQSINTYDDFGIPGANNTGRFGYTGQAWNTTLGMWYYKARIYSPNLGRFMQTDPIGYQDGLNWYNYVDGDPVNATDPSGLDTYYLSGSFTPSYPTFANTGGNPVFSGFSYALTILSAVKNFAGHHHKDKTASIAPRTAATQPTARNTTIDNSCAGVSAVRDPDVQQRALQLTRLQAENGREFGFFSARGGILRLYNRYNGPDFSSPDTTDNRTIRSRDINLNYFPDGRTVYAPDLLMHSHRFRGVGGDTWDGDYKVATDGRFTVAAVQPNGRITCTKGAR